MVTKVTAAMVAADVATQAELDAEAVLRAAGSKMVGDVVQVAYARTGAVATTTTVMPFDDTVPQITEGAEFLTASITPASATNKLLIEAVFNGSCSTTSYITVGLFQDATASALVAASKYGTNGSYEQVVLSCLVDAGTTSATTIRLRAGQHTAGTLTMNGDGGARRLGGAMATTLTITEIKV